jgi:hypothetical protein
MANRYWVGSGGQNWDGTAGTKWALTSGGAGGQAVPTTADDVFFDSNSGASTIAISTGNTGAKSINLTGFSGGGLITGTAAITVAGSVTLASGPGFGYTGTMTITGSGTITSATKTFNNLVINGVGITVTLGDALSVTKTAGTSTLTLTNGTLNLAGFNSSAAIFSSDNSNTRTLAFGSGNLALTSTTAATNSHPYTPSVTQGHSSKRATYTIG